MSILLWYKSVKQQEVEVKICEIACGKKFTKGVVKIYKKICFPEWHCFGLTSFAESNVYNTLAT